MKNVTAYLLCSVIIFILSFSVFYGCGKSDNAGDDDDGANRAQNESKSSCLNGYKSTDDDSVEGGHAQDIIIDFADGAATFTHHYAPRNCGFNELVATYEAQRGTLNVTEGEPAADGTAMCGCCFNLDYTIPNLESAAYALTITGKYADGAGGFTYQTILETQIDFGSQTHYEFDLGTTYCG